MSEPLRSFAISGPDAAAALDWLHVRCDLLGALDVCQHQGNTGSNANEMGVAAMVLRGVIGDGGMGNGEVGDVRVTGAPRDMRRALRG